MHLVNSESKSLLVEMSGSNIVLYVYHVRPSKVYSDIDRDEMDGYDSSGDELLKLEKLLKKKLEHG